MKSYEWIKKVRTALELTSDNQAAQHIGITRSAVSMHKAGKVKALNDGQCMRVAELLGINPAEVIADQHAEATENPALKSVWQNMAKTLSQSAALAVTDLALLPAMESASRYILC